LFGKLRGHFLLLFDLFGFQNGRLCLTGLFEESFLLSFFHGSFFSFDLGSFCSFFSFVSFNLGDICR